MEKSMRQHSIVVRNATSATPLADTSGSPGESYRWSRMAAVRRAWQHHFGSRYVEASQLTFTQMRNIEARVRKALYP